MAWKLIHPSIAVGALEDYQGGDFHERGPDEVAILHAAKEPYHRQFVGYTERGAPKEHAEYLTAMRVINEVPRLALNFIDAPRAEFIQAPMINQAYSFADRAMREDRRLYVHCNKGESRAPMLGFMLLQRLEPGRWGGGDFEEAWEEYEERFFPDRTLNPSKGVWDWGANEFRRLRRSVPS